MKTILNFEFANGYDFGICLSSSIIVKDKASSSNN